MLILALGFGLGVMALTQAAVYDVRPNHAGIASALLNSAQQIGVTLGLTVLAGVAAAITASHSSYTDATRNDALVAGYGGALLVATWLLLAAAVLAVITLSNRPATTCELQPGGPTQDA